MLYYTPCLIQNKRVLGLEIKASRVPNLNVKIADTIR
jgi:hypothetical protein